MKTIKTQHPPNSDSVSPTTQKNVIHPIDFTPASGRFTGRQWRIEPVKVCIVFAMIIIILVAGFVLTARSLVVNTIPHYAEVTISGGLSLALGSRYLLRAGEYKITVNAPGYFTITEPLSINNSQNQRVEFALQKTPGLLQLNTVPEQGVEVIIDGQSIDRQAQNMTSDNVLELSAGEHHIRLSAARYLPQEIVFKVEGKGKKQILNTSLKPAWASVNFTSLPEKAIVSVDGQPIGETPLYSDIIQGEHSIEFQREGYETFSKNIKIVAGQPQEIASETLKPVSAWLQLNTQPSQANVTFDNEFKGQTPLRLAVRPGEKHQLAVFKAGYERISRQIELSSDEKSTLLLKLNAQLAIVKIRTIPADAHVFIDGKVTGIGSQTLQLPAYQQRLEVRKAGFQSQSRDVTPRPGFDQSITIRLLTEQQAKWAKIKPRLITAGGQELLLFRPDTFVMGASRREAGRRSNESLRTVAMTRPFYLGNKEVSNAQFRLFKSEHSSGHMEGQSLDGDQQPVVKVTWEQAVAYCNWLSKRDSLKPFYQIDKKKAFTTDLSANGYRLPTEAEWAWAARTGKKQPLLKFPWGASLPPPNHSGNYADADSASITGRAIANYQDGFSVTAPVGSFSKNQHALFDMGGNVAEWINDYYGLSTHSSNKVITDPTGPSSGEYRVIRGSSWAHGTVTELRFSYRDYGREARNDLGFRLARYVE